MKENFEFITTTEYSNQQNGYRRDENVTVKSINCLKIPFGPFCL